MPTSTSGQLAVITVSPNGTVVESTNGADTGHVVLGVVGGLALVIFIVVIVVPVMRWRQRGGTLRSISSRVSSRKTHSRIYSGAEAHVQAPLLESQPVDPSSGEPAMSEKGKGKEVQFGSNTLEIPQSWKILEKIPDFGESDSLSSLGKPLAPAEQTFKQTEGSSALHTIVASDSIGQQFQSGLEPHQQETGASQQSESMTLVDRSTSDTQKLMPPTSPTLPLTNAFQRAQSLTSTISPSITSGSASTSTFRYPSVVASETSKSPAPSAVSQSSPDPSSLSTPEASSSRSRPPSLNLSSLARTPTWFTNPQGLLSSVNVHLPPSTSKTHDARLRRGPMPSIPESLRSGFSASSSENPAIPVPPAQPTAKLRESVQNVVSSAVRHSRGLSTDTGVSLAASIDITRSNTSHTQKTSESAADVEPPGSALTHYTFGQPNPAQVGIMSLEFFTPPKFVTTPAELSAQPSAHSAIAAPVVAFSSTTQETTTREAGGPEMNTVPFPVQPSPAVTPGSTTGYIIYETDGRKTTTGALQSRFSSDTESASHAVVTTAPSSEEGARRRTISLPREPSPPLVPAPLSHPPLPPPLRHTGPRRALPTLPPHIPSSDPNPVLPNVPSDVQREPGELREGSEEDAPATPSSTTENLIPRVPTPQLTLGLRPMSPFRFDFGFGLGSGSRSSTPAPGQASGSGQVSRHSTQKSKASSRSGSAKFSKRSKSGSRSRSRDREGGSSTSGSKGRGSRRVTFGFGFAPPSPTASSVGAGSRPPSRSSSVGGGGGAASPYASIRPLPQPPVPPVPPLPSSVPGSAPATPPVPEIPLPPPSAFPAHPTSQQKSARTSLTNDTSAAEAGHGNA